MVDTFSTIGPATTPSPSPELRLAIARHLADVGDVRSRMDRADLLIAEDGNAVVGAVTLLRPTTGAHRGEPWPPEWAVMRLLAVRTSDRGRGVGRALTQACIVRARELGAPALALHTTIDLVVARAMYQRLGFRPAPKFDQRPAPEIHAEAFVLPLASAL